MSRVRFPLGWLLALAVAGLTVAGCSDSSPASGKAETATAAVPPLVKQKCLQCHAAQGNENRITQMRKSPEGWEATIRRMQRVWKLEVNEDEVKQLVKELSDAQGLAPTEAEKVQYWAVADPTLYETQPEPLKNACIQCHSAGRALAQYRTPQEWQRIKDTHLGLNPSIPIVGEFRFKDWQAEAAQALDWLASQNPLETEDWRNWQNAKWPGSAEGEWLLAGTQQGKGGFSGSVQLKKTGTDEYEQTGHLVFGDGTRLELTGSVRVYTGFWGRASLQEGNDKVRGYYRLSADGKQIIGDWIGVENPSLRTQLTMQRLDHPGVLQVYPSAVQVGKKTTVRVTAAGISGTPDPSSLQAGDGVQVTAIRQVESGSFDVDLTVTEQAAAGVRKLQMAGAGEIPLTVYQRVDYIRVTPRDAYSRVGAANGSLPSQLQYQATGYDVGPDGKEGTADDLAVGPVPVRWFLSEHKAFEGDNEDDVSVVGTLSASGLFTPGAPGPNPNRAQSVNNTGTVYVNAVHRRPDGTEVQDKTVLLVTAPIWRDVH